MTTKIIKNASLQQSVSDFFSSIRFLTPIFIAAVVGMSTGFIAVGFIKMVAVATDLFFGRGGQALNFMGRYYVVLIPALGGLLVGPLIKYLAPEAKGHGVPEVLKAIALKEGKIRPVVVVVKALASIISLGSGASVGREGPIVQVGSAFGSSVGQLLRLSPMRIKNLIACGAASGIAAVFNAPIAGVMFAAEVILKDFGVSSLSTVVVAAVSSSIVSRTFLGESPAFDVPLFRLQSPWEILIYLGLGVLSAFAALFFIYSLGKSEEFWEHVKLPEWFKPAVGGLFVGVIGIYFPQVFGSGLTGIEGTLHGNFPLLMLLALILLKTVATSISLGSGSSGGVFAPALFIGSVLGGAVGKLVEQKFSFPVESSGAYALVGMACVFSAAAHAPVTAILIVFEMTDSYHLILPIMAAVVVATSISQALHRESIYTVKLKQKGIDVGFLEEVRVLNGLQVRDAMNTNFELIPNNLPSKELIAKLSKQPDKSTFTVDPKGQLTGIIKYEEVQKFLLEDSLDMVLAEDIAVPVREYCFSEESLSEAARQLSAYHLTHLPVVDANDTNKVVGVLRSEDVLRVFAQGALQRSDMVSQIEQAGTSGGVITTSFVVAPRSQMVGKAIKELHLVDGVRFSSITRRGAFILPQGNVMLQARDKVVVTLMFAQINSFNQWLKQQQGSLDT